MATEYKLSYKAIEIDEKLRYVDNLINSDEGGYATEQFVRNGFQPKGNYLTEVPEGYAKTNEIPKKAEDIGAQPAGDYALKSELPTVPVQSVNGKTGNVELSASDVGARPEDWMPTAQDIGALPNTYTPPNQTAEQVGADPKGAAANTVSQHNTANDSHNDIRLNLQAINDRLTAFFDSDNQTLDELSEIVAYITSNKSLIDSITTSKVSVADIINNLTTNVSNKPLSSAQGVVLKGLIDTLSSNLANYQPKGDYALRSEIPTVPVKSVNGKTGAISLGASDVGALPTGTKIPAKTSDLTNDSGFITGYTETDPTVPAWAKASSKPSYSKSEVGLSNVDNVKQYSANNPPPYPVQSVNGMTGAVTISVPTKVSQLQNDSGFLTEISKEEIVQQVIVALGTPVFGRVDTNKNIILTGELVNGTYTVKYEFADGTTMEIGTLDHNADAPSYTNLLNTYTIYRDKRNSTSNADTGYLKTSLGAIAVDIPYSDIIDKTLRIKAPNIDEALADGKRTSFYTFSISMGFMGYAFNQTDSYLRNAPCAVNEGNNTYSFLCTADNFVPTTKPTNTLRITIVVNTTGTAVTDEELSQVVITIDEPII